MIIIILLVSFRLVLYVYDRYSETQVPRTPDKRGILGELVLYVYDRYSETQVPRTPDKRGILGDSEGVI